VQWGLFGMTDNKTIIYASVVSGAASLVKKAPTALATTLTHYHTFATAYNTDLPYQGLTVGVEQLVGTGPTDTAFGTWIGNTTTAPYFSVYNVSLVNGVAGNLDVYGTTASTSTLEGTLTVGTNGVISAVPEPSTYVLFGLGALVLGITLRRRRNA